MPVRQPPVTEAAVRVLLDSIVDYAGLFPPAETGMAIAVRNFAHYRASGTGWLLGRFVCPASALEVFSREADAYLPRDAGAISWCISVTGSGDLENDMTAIDAFNERHRVCFDECSAVVDAYEVKALNPQDIVDIGQRVPRALKTFIEIPVRDDPVSMLETIAVEGRRAKIRTGGITRDAFPDSAHVARFLEVCVHTGVTAKATAGLHHALRGTYPLTYLEHATTAPMFGFLNVFLAAVLVEHGAPTRDVVAMLEETDAGSIRIAETHCTWKGNARTYELERGLIARVRERVLNSFGSCSYTEPVEETRALGWI